LALIVFSAFSSSKFRASAVALVDPQVASQGCFQICSTFHDLKTPRMLWPWLHGGRSSRHLAKHSQVAKNEIAIDY